MCLNKHLKRLSSNKPLKVELINLTKEQLAMKTLKLLTVSDIQCNLFIVA